MIKKITRIFKLLYRKIFPGLVEYLRKELSDCTTALDLGCGCNSPIQYCNVLFSIGVELFDAYLEESKKKSIHNQYIKADITKIEFKPKSFDAILCLEVLEHLTKEEGYELIKRMKKWAKKKIIISVPNGFIEQHGYDGNPFQEHHSGWKIEEFKNLGFKVRGNNGPKFLWNGLEIKYKPKFLWVRVSDLIQKITYYYPKAAYQLFAIKKLKK